MSQRKILLKYPEILDSSMSMHKYISNVQILHVAFCKN